MREVQLAAGGRQVAPTFPLSVPIQTLPIQTLPIQTLPGWGGVFLVFLLGATGRPFKLYMFLKRGLMSGTHLQKHIVKRTVIFTNVNTFHL